MSCARRAGDAANEVTTEHSEDARKLAANRSDKLFFRLWRVALDFSSDVTPEVLDDDQIRTLWRPHILCQQLANAWTVAHPRYCLHRCVRSCSILLKMWRGPRARRLKATSADNTLEV